MVMEEGYKLHENISREKAKNVRFAERVKELQQRVSEL